MKPAPPRDPRGPIFIAMCAAGILISLGAMCMAPKTPTAARPAPSPVADVCADAVTRVQQYKAPGAQVTVQDAVRASVAAERRPVQVEGWLRPDAHPPQCFVALRLTLGNERREPMWVLDTTTGRVDALDDLAKQYSGWR